MQPILCMPFVIALVSHSVVSHAADSIFRTGQEWTGTYSCADGPMRAVLLVREVADLGTSRFSITARLSYESSSGRGSRGLKGNFTASDRQFELVPAAVGVTLGPKSIRGQVSADGGTLRAVVDDARCTALVLSSTNGAQVAAPSMGSQQDWISSPPDILNLDNARKASYLEAVGRVSQTDFQRLPKLAACKHMENVLALDAAASRQLGSAYDQALATLVARTLQFTPTRDLQRGALEGWFRGSACR
jgi:hypothetical protein